MAQNFVVNRLERSYEITIFVGNHYLPCFTVDKDGQPNKCP